MTLILSILSGNVPQLLPLGSWLHNLMSLKCVPVPLPLASYTGIQDLVRA